MKLNAEQQAALDKYRAKKSAGNESNWTLSNLGESALRGLKQRGAGAIELGMNLAEGLGADIPEEYQQARADVQQQYVKEGGGTGTVGFVGEMLGDPLTYLPIGGGAKNLVKGVAGAGALSGLTTSTGKEDSALSDQLRNAAIQAGVGAIAGKVTQKLMRPVSGSLDDVAAKNVSLLEKEGVKLQPSQKTGSKTLSLVEEAFKGLPFTSGKQARINEAQLGQFTKAALKRAGIQSDLATPEVLQVAAKSFGNKFDDLIQKSGGIKVDDELLQALANADSEATRRLGSDSVGRMVHSYIDDVLETGGILDAKTYQNTRSALGRIAKGTQDPLLGNVLMDLRGALDAAAERSIKPGLVKLWGKTRKEYAAFKTIEGAMNRVGEQAVSGYITPANLLNAVKTGNKQYARGAGVLNDLARAGKDIVSSTLPDSGTATRTMMQNVLTGGGLATAGGVSGGLPAVGAALAAPRVIQEVYNTRPVQKYITEGITKSTIPAIAAAKTAIQAARREAQGEEAPSNQLSPEATKALQEYRQQKSSPQSSLAPLPEDIRADEGLRHSAYNDTAGNRTIAWGFNMDSGIARRVWKDAKIPSNFDEVYSGKIALTTPETEALAAHSFKIATNDAADIYDNFSELSEPRKQALLNMSYQFGKPRLMKLTEFNAAVNRGDWKKAVIALQKTKYWKQTPERARENARKLLRST